MLPFVKELAKQAGAKILEIYNGEMGITYKEDASPLTLADQAAHEVISKGLAQHFPEIPVISEEGHMPAYEDRRHLPRFFLVDPLDGTKEFIKKNGEFTVNIALIEANEPVMGVVYLPVWDKLYAADRNGDATVEVAGAAPTAIHAKDTYQLDAMSVAMSRSHPSEKLNSFLGQFSGLDQQPLGSALKFCNIAEGSIDFYPRFGGLMEWDTAAAHAVANRAGVVITDLSGNPLGYNKPDMRHNGLIAASHQALLDELLKRMN